MFSDLSVASFIVVIINLELRTGFENSNYIKYYNTLRTSARVSPPTLNYIKYVNFIIELLKLHLYLISL